MDSEFHSYSLWTAYNQSLSLEATLNEGLEFKRVNVFCKEDKG